MLRGVLMAMGIGAASPALAHPHVFMQTDLTVLRDAAGRAVSLQVTWTYDPFFSLVLITERGLDPDADGVLTPEETAALQGFDMAWEPGFPGDTYAFAGETAVALSALVEQLDPEVVIYDMPPALGTDDVLAMAPSLDAVLLVADGTKSTAEDLRACERLFEGRIPLMGVVLNRAQDRAAQRRGYGKA
jgi:xanthine/CO dehydrogenase XdhC/CoxF family maturation factor